jgi:predicted DNA-binding transcriptional regulator AlpA
MSGQPITELPDPLLNVAEVADLIGTSPGSIYNGRRAGTGVGALGFRIGRKLRFDPRDVAEFIESQKVRDPKHLAVTT